MYVYRVWPLIVDANASHMYTVVAPNPLLNFRGVT